MSAHGDTQPGVNEQSRDRVPSVEPSGGSRRPVKVDARALAWIAEHAHGLGGKPLALVQEKDGEVKLKAQSEVHPQDDFVLLEVETPLVRPDRLRLERITIQPQGGPAFDLKGCDALFWTESAIQKFMLPYYHAQRLLDDVGMKELMDAFHSRDVVAIAHVPPSRHETIRGMDPLGAVCVITKSGDSTSANDPGLQQAPLREFLSRKHQ